MSLNNYRMVQPGEGVTYTFSGLGMTIVSISTAEDSEGERSIFESIHEPGSGAPLHIHHHQDETAYVVEGEFLVQSGDEAVQRVGPGAFAHFPRGLAHSFKCVGEMTGKILFLITPGGFEKFFADMAEAMGDGPPDMEKMRAIGQAHDSEIIGPLIADNG